MSIGYSREVDWRDSVPPRRASLREASPVHQQFFDKRLSIPNGKKGGNNGTLEVKRLVAQVIGPPKGANPV